MISTIVRTAPMTMPAIARPFGCPALPSFTAATMLRMRPIGAATNARTSPTIDSTRPGGLGSGCGYAGRGGRRVAGGGPGVPRRRPSRRCGRRGRGRGRWRGHRVRGIRCRRFGERGIRHVLSCRRGERSPPAVPVAPSVARALRSHHPPTMRGPWAGAGSGSCPSVDLRAGVACGYVSEHRPVEQSRARSDR